MRNVVKAMAVLVVSLALILVFVPAAQASCPTITPHACCGVAWNQFDVDSSCLTSYGASATTMACDYPSGSLSGYTYDMGFDNYTTWTFTVPGSGSYTPYAYWSARASVTFSAPNTSPYNGIRGYVAVTHNNSTTYYDWFYVYGNTSSAETCVSHDVFFSATNGDTIALIIENTRWDSDAVTEAAIPIVFNEQ